MSAYQELNLSRKQHFRFLLIPEIMFTFEFIKSLPHNLVLMLKCSYISRKQCIKPQTND